ncbi:MAG: hypothetical protein IPK89_08860 [Sphingomonadales bacterium]|nr:hypothetical protein [Sphingomonadales bacterium]MBK6719562.1 hypothetical protein [Sphingomonadales bacterium]MBK8273063.1 hypothetical protein [Sphingomonadales bacterium]MBK8859613.1 hypothetical protein [Sphingomonadales bacterium]
MGDDEWLSFHDAIEVVRASAGHEKLVHSRAALLFRIRNGQIRWNWKALSSTNADTGRDVGDQQFMSHDDAAANFIFALHTLARRDQSAFFDVEIDHIDWNLGEFSLTVSYKSPNHYGIHHQIKSVRLLRDDVVREFPSASNPEYSRSPPVDSQTDTPKRKSGRPKGTGAYQKGDMLIAEKMHEFISINGGGKFSAAAIFVKDAGGPGTDDSKKRRLVLCYDRLYGDN